VRGCFFLFGSFHSFVLYSPLGGFFGMHGMHGMHRLQVVRLSENLHSWNVSAYKMGGHFAALGDSYTLMSAEVKRFDTLGVG
jgi:hypothetical protein